MLHLTTLVDAAYFFFFLQSCLSSSVTPGESSKTWGRSSVFQKDEEGEEEKRGQKKKGRTWGPGTLCSKELTSSEDG